MAALWIAAPSIALVLSRPVPSRRVPLDDADRAFLRDIAARTWKYFDTFVGPGDRALPPDNVQTMPDERVAQRTSPTNIGMGLLSTLAAHDFGFIDVDQLIERLDDTLTAIDALEKHRRAPAELVQHGVACAAAAPLRVHRRQRQSRRARSSPLRPA